MSLGYDNGDDGLPNWVHVLQIVIAVIIACAVAYIAWVVIHGMRGY